MNKSVRTVDKTFEVLERTLRRQGGPAVDLHEYGVVRSVGEGIARAEGLPNVQVDEVVLFEKGQRGLTYNLDPASVGIIMLDDEREVQAGDEVLRTGAVLTVPVGEQLIGRVMDALGRPLDGRGGIFTPRRYPVERPAPPIMHRAPVQTPLQTGLMAIDALVPVGRGQRELILGDRQTGKTAIAVDTIINQRSQEVICIYCAVGKQQAGINRVIADLRRAGALEYTLVVAAGSGTSAGLQYIAPFAATSMAEYFMEQGQDVLIIYDDLTWHARAYRELALLLRRPPGREAFPGDIFFLHARLLERSTRLNADHGGGSVTALPIIETEAQDISAFIPTNLISITDGQIYLSPQLFQKDIRPAVDVGLSVSRVGGAAQPAVLRSVAQPLKLAYAQFEELESFARFSSRLDEDTRKRIERGRRIREVLKQPQFDPLALSEQTEIIRAVTSGRFDGVPLEQIGEAKAVIRKALRNLPEELRDQAGRGGQPQEVHDHIGEALNTWADKRNSVNTTPLSRHHEPG